MLRYFTGTLLGRLGFSTAALVFLTGSIVGLIASQIARGHLTQELSSKLAAQGRLGIGMVPLADFSARRAEALDAWAGGFAAKTGARVSLIAGDGAVLADSEVRPGNLPAIENHADRPEIAAALAFGEGSAIRLSRTVGIELMYVAVPILEGGEAVGALRLALPVAEIEGKVSNLRAGIALGTGACLLGALLISVLVTRSIHRPIRLLADSAGRIAHGDLKTRIELPPTDELGDLGRAMNALLTRVADTVGALSSETAQLQATLDNMVEGVVLVDAESRIQALNPVIEELFSVKSREAAGKPLHDSIRNLAIQELAAAAIRDGSPQMSEITLSLPDERHFECYVRPVFQDGAVESAVIVLHDITRLRRLEEVRKEFVANVSHELRTPLASIKGFAETLRRGGLEDEKNRRGFVLKIEKHSDRLTKLIDELLDLAAIEQGKREFRPVETPLAEVVDQIISGLEPLAEEKGVALKNEIDPVMKVKADPAALRQVFQNLLDNAVKYNRKDGTVVVRAEVPEGSAEITVADTGIGVPEKVIPRLFERFYRVDKARSRELGGTGLGLSIVKHIIEAHGGTIGAESVEGKGTTFRVTLPVGSPRV